MRKINSVLVKIRHDVRTIMTLALATVKYDKQLLDSLSHERARARRAKPTSDRSVGSQIDRWGPRASARTVIGIKTAGAAIMTSNNNYLKILLGISSAVTINSSTILSLHAFASRFINGKKGGLGLPPGLGLRPGPAGLGHARASLRPQTLRAYRACLWAQTTGMSIVAYSPKR